MQAEDWAPYEDLMAYYSSDHRRWSHLTSLRDFEEQYVDELYVDHGYPMLRKRLAEEFSSDEEIYAHLRLVLLGESSTPNRVVEDNSVDSGSGSHTDTSVRMLLSSTQGHRRELDLGSASDLDVRLGGAGLGSWFRSTDALPVALGGTPYRIGIAGADTTVTHEPENDTIVIDVTLGSDGLAGANTAALRSLVDDQSRCFYLQFGDCVAVSATGGFTKVDPIALTLMRIASAVSPGGGNELALPWGAGEIGQIVRHYRLGRNRDYFSVHPGDHHGTPAEYEVIQDLIQAAHPHRDVVRA